jgi:hypothetical protein
VIVSALPGESPAGTRDCPSSHALARPRAAGAGWKHTEPFKGSPSISGCRHPAAPPDPGTERVYEDSGFLWAGGSNDTDVSYHATRAYYAVYEQLRARHPRLLFEICNDGGRMVDFGSAAHGDYFAMTDTYDPLSNRRVFDASYVLPPAMLESYVAAWPAPNLETFRYLLHGGVLGWFSLTLDSGHWTAEQHADALAQFALYKSALRPLIRIADLYHVSRRPDRVHWVRIEY